MSAASDKRALDRDRARRRAAQAVELRIAGHTYAQIAEALKYANAGGAFKAVQRAIAAEAEEQSGDRKALRQRQHLRINRLLSAVWGAAMKGDAKAVAAARQLLEREARLLGLDEPTNLRITEALDPEIEALLEQMGILPGDGEGEEPASS